MTIGEKILELRQERRMTQKELGERLQICKKRGGTIIEFGVIYEIVLFRILCWFCPRYWCIGCLESNLPKVFLQ